MKNKVNKIIISSLAVIAILLSFCLSNYSNAEENARQCAEKGFAYLDKGLFDEAMEEFKKILQVDSNSYTAYYGIGLAYSFKEMFDEAIDFYKKAIEINPDFAIAYFHLGVDYTTKGLFEEAVFAYENAVKLNPRFKKAEYPVHAYSNLGAKYAREKNLDKAISAYKKAIEIDPKNSIAYNNLGIVYYDKKMFEESISCNEKAITIEPQSPTAYNNLGNSCFDYAIALISTNNVSFKEKTFALIERAVENFRKTIELNPNSDAAEMARQSLNDLVQQGIIKQKSDDGFDVLRESTTGGIISFYLDADEDNLDEEVLKIVDIKNKKFLFKVENKYLKGYETKIMSAAMDNDLERLKEIIEQAKAEYYKKYKEGESKREIDLLSGKRYANRKLGFSIIPPKEWEIKEQEGYVAISKPFDPFGSTIYIVVEISPNKENLSLANLKEKFIDKIRSSVDESYQIKILQDKETNVAGMPAYSCTYEVVDVGVTSSAKNVGFIKEDRQYFIEYISGSSPYEFKKYLPVFEKSLATFKIE